MEFFALHPMWHNYSSMIREACAADEAGTDMERAHHMAATLYFGIAALESFVNENMRAHLKANGATEETIFAKLRFGTKLKEKLAKWPAACGVSYTPSDALRALLSEFSSVRGELTHPKATGPSTYRNLMAIAAGGVVVAVAEYIVRFREKQAQMYPYWVFGWNYLGPSRDGYTITMVNEQQFGFSLKGLGFQLDPHEPGYPSAWQRRYLMTYDGFTEIRRALDGIDGCEPKHPRLPYRPTLCRRWWDPAHQRSCGAATREAIAHAIKLGGGH